MSARQRTLYKALRSHVSVAELMDKASSHDEAGLKSLMNLVMQFRKVSQQTVCVLLHLADKHIFYLGL